METTLGLEQQLSRIKRGVVTNIREAAMDMRKALFFCLVTIVLAILPREALTAEQQGPSEEGTYYLFPHVPFVISVPPECTSWYMGATGQDERYRSNPLMFFKKESRGLPFISTAVDYFDDLPEEIKKAWKDPAHLLRWKAGEDMKFEVSTLPDAELLKEEMIQVNGLPANSRVLRSQKSNATYHFISILFPKAIVQVGLNAPTVSFEADDSDFMRIVNTIRDPDLPFEITFPPEAGIWKASAVPTAVRLERGPFNLSRKGGLDLPKIASSLVRYEQATPEDRQLWDDPPRLLKSMMEKVVERSRAAGFPDLAVVKEEAIDVNGSPALSTTLEVPSMTSTYHYVDIFFPKAFFSMMLFSKSEEFASDDAEFMRIVNTIKKRETVGSRELGVGR